MSDTATTTDATSAPPVGSIAWFEVGAADPDGAERFYGKLFGWTFTSAPAAGFDYREITTGAGHPLRGGVLGTGGKMPPHAVFVVLVDDVAATGAETERLGGHLDVGPITADNGLSFAYLRDPEGNRFGVFSPPTAG